MEEPKKASTASDMMRNGRAAWKSASASTRCSVKPRNRAAAKPSAVPKTAESTVAPKAMISETRIDWISRDSTSRPSSSVPSQCFSVPGADSRLVRSIAVMS